MKERVSELAKHYFPAVQAIRRHIHQHPELSFEEYKTSEFIQSKLKEVGIPYQTGYVKTGIVALIKGKNPDKKTILLRADMDALPIEEKNEVPYKSIHQGKMHACGHDVHSACCLGAAFILNELKKEWEGTVKIMFQPGEEVLPGGAGLMIQEGVLENPKVDKALALHVFPSMETGKLGFKPGMYMASTDELYVTVTGKGGHAAMPAEYNSPLIAASDFILETEKTFMNSENRNVLGASEIPTVVAFGKIEGKGATNVIPETVELAGTFRTMNEEWRNQVHRGLKEIAEKVAAKYNLTIDLRIEKGYPFLVNDVNFTQACIQSAQHYVGKQNVDILPIRMTAEDFAFISQKVPSCFFRLGTGNMLKGISSGVHTSTFNIDEKALEIGMGALAAITIQELNS